jgi:hypothetical protein
MREWHQQHTNTVSPSASSHCDAEPALQHGAEGHDGSKSSQELNKAIEDRPPPLKLLQRLSSNVIPGYQLNTHSQTLPPISEVPQQPFSSIVPEPMGILLRERDVEITNLRARLDDMKRMICALRNAARKRNVASDPDHSSQRRKLSQDTNGPAGAFLLTECHKRTESMDEFRRVLDEMMQDQVETVEPTKGNPDNYSLPTGSGYSFNCSSTWQSLSGYPSNVTPGYQPNIHSRVQPPISVIFQQPPPNIAHEPAGMLLQEKVAEIANLRARLDDMKRMGCALRSAARKRDVADALLNKPRPPIISSKVKPRHQWAYRCYSPDQRPPGNQNHGRI